MSSEERKNSTNAFGRGEIFRRFYRYWRSIVLLALVFALAATLYAYFKPDIYLATATVDIGTGETCSSNGKRDSSDGSDSASLAKEIEIVRSRFLLEQALQNVDFSHHYYVKFGLKEKELYKASPFDVNLTKGFGTSFKILYQDQTHYSLTARGIDRESQKKWSYSGIHPYGSLIENKHFSFTLNSRKKELLKDKHYRFVVLKEKSAIDRAQKDICVSELGKHSNILAIHIKDNVPLRAQELADALAEAYIAQNVYKKSRETSKALSFVKAQLEQITDNLRHSAVKLENFKKESNAVNLEGKSKRIMERLNEAEGRLATIEIEVGFLNTLYSQVKSGKHLETISLSGLSGSDVDQAGSQVLANLVTNLQQAMMKLRVLRADYTESYPEVIRLKRQIVEMKKIIIDTIKNMKTNYDERKKLLEKSIAEQTKLMEKLPEAERVYGGLQRKFVVNERIYSYLLEKQAATAIDQASTVSKNRILDHALYPDHPIEPNRKVIILFGLLLGLIVGILQALLRNYFDNKIRNDEDIKGATEAPLLGVIPHFRKKVEGLRALESPKSGVAEAFRNLRTNLQFMSAGKSSQVIAVTSTVGGEGKTELCANLAGIISLTGKRVIVLNLDMRKPTLHERFGLENEIGMSTVLSCHAAISEVIQHTKYKNLDMIASGPIPPNPSELIQSKRMEELIEMLRTVYPVIILDTPPVGLVTDARTLMGFSDISIYLLRAGQSKKAFLRQADMFFHSDGIQGFSVVLNDVKMTKEGYGYGYGYYEEDL